jgi:hypothetical protein
MLYRQFLTLIAAVVCLGATATGQTAESAQATGGS